MCDSGDSRPRPLPSGRPVSEGESKDDGVVGYVVLTSQPDGSWQPDWDGILHTEFIAAVVELAIAGRGWPAGARLVECREIDWESFRLHVMEAE